MTKIEPASVTPSPLELQVSLPLNISIDGDLVAGLSTTIVPREGAGPIMLKGNPRFPIWLVSRNAGGFPADGISLSPSLNYDASRLVFVSTGENLANRKLPTCGDSETSYTCAQVYAIDLRSGAIQLVSSSSSGEPGNAASLEPQIDGAGSAVVFTSVANNFATQAASQTRNIFVKQLATQDIFQANVATDGTPGSIETDPNDDIYGTRCAAYCGGASIADSSNFVAFGSWSSNLVPDDGNRRPDVFVRDFEHGNTLLASSTTDGSAANDASYTLSGGRYISNDGLRVAFTSAASNLADGLPTSCAEKGIPEPPYATHACPQIYVKDFMTGDVILASASPSGTPGSSISQAPVISGDGTKVAFLTAATEIVGDSANGRPQVVLKDLRTGQVRLISQHADGKIWDQDIIWIAMDESGQRVAFSSSSAIQSAGPGARREVDSAFGVFVFDSQLAGVQRMSMTQDGIPSRGSPIGVALSGNGKWLAFDSDASDIVGGAVDGSHNVFLVNVDAALDPNAHGLEIPGFSVFAGMALVVSALLKRYHQHWRRRRS